MKKRSLVGLMTPQYKKLPVTMKMWMQFNVMPRTDLLPNKERQAHLNLQLFELRGLHFDLIFYYTILNNQSSIDKKELYYFSHHPQPYTIDSKASATDRLLSSFRCHSVDCWNSLPLELQNATSLHSFKIVFQNSDLTMMFTCTTLNDFNAIFVFVLYATGQFVLKIYSSKFGLKLRY